MRTKWSERDKELNEKFISLTKIHEALQLNAVDRPEFAYRMMLKEGIQLTELRTWFQKHVKGYIKPVPEGQYRGVVTEQLLKGLI